MSLKNFQLKIGTSPDGVFGPNTLKKAQIHLNINDFEAAHFFGQTGHETAHFKTFSENLKYGRSGLLRYFKSYFDHKNVDLYTRHAVKIANRVYSNRMGNGNEASGDGWKYRGRGALQLTGKYNYKAFSAYIKDPSIMYDPNLVESKYSFESALFYFDEHGIWDICSRGIDDDTIKKVTKVINGGYNGLKDRIVLTNKYYKYLN